MTLRCVCGHSHADHHYRGPWPMACHVCPCTEFRDQPVVSTTAEPRLGAADVAQNETATPVMCEASVKLGAGYTASVPCGQNLPCFVHPSTPVPGDSELARLATDARDAECLHAAWHDASDLVRLGLEPVDAAFVAAANPKAVLDLIARLEAANAEIALRRARQIETWKANAELASRCIELECAALESQPTQTAARCDMVRYEGLAFAVLGTGTVNGVEIALLGPIFNVVSDRHGLAENRLVPVSELEFVSSGGRASVPTRMPTREQIAMALFESRSSPLRAEYTDVEWPALVAQAWALCADKSRYYEQADAVLSLVTEGTRGTDRRDAPEPITDDDNGLAFAALVFAAKHWPHGHWRTKFAKAANKFEPPVAVGDRASATPVSDEAKQ